jgi:hypothetical protein
MAFCLQHAIRAQAAALASALLVFVAFVDDAQAQSCCVSTGASDFAVVGRMEAATIAAMLQYEATVATYTQDGEYVPMQDAVIGDAVFKIGVGLRPLRAVKGWQLNLAVPLRYQYRDLQGMPAAQSFGLGDISFGTRYTLLEDRLLGMRLDDPKSFIPFVDLIVGAKSPTGRPAEESDEPSGADAMGDGSWSLSFGAAVHKFVTRRHSVLVGFDYELRLPHDVASSGDGFATAQYDPGDATTYRLAWQYAPNAAWSGSLFTSVRVTYPSKLDGEVIEQSQSLRWRVGLSVTWVFVKPTWEVTASVTTDPWWDGVGFNLPFVGPTAALQLRRNFR